MSAELKEAKEEALNAPETAEPEKQRRGNPLAGLWRNRKWRKRLLLILAAAVLLLAVQRGCRGKAAAAGPEYVTEPVTYRSLRQTLTGSGTLQPANSYVVTTLKEGEVLSADFEKGDVVTKGTVLYQLDSSDISSNLEKTQLTLDQARRSYEKAAYAQTPVAGIVTALNVAAGDFVRAGDVVATVRDASVMTLKVPFAADDAAGFSVGQSAQVTLDGSFETLEGRVSMVSSADEVLTGNRIVRYVTIQVENPGSLTESQAATAEIDGCGSSGSANLKYKNSADVTASSGGTVGQLLVREGAAVSAGQNLMVFTSNAQNDQVQSAADSLRSAELSMQSVQEQLDDYTITSPIDGTIVEKQYKTGDTVESGKTLCTIYDLSYLEMTLNIDELDISQVSVGLPVSITADAVAGQAYQGVITEVSVAGTTSNGSTSYPVTIRIDETDGLRPGMNVDAEIVTAENDNALTISGAALERGNRVLVTADSPSAAQAMEDSGAPEGYAYVAVEIGLSDDDYIEVTSGLQEGDVVAYLKADTAGNGMNMMMAAGPAEGPEGGPPPEGGPGGGPRG